MCVFKVIAAEGEQKASRALKEASEVIAESSSALQLRYLQVQLIPITVIKCYKESQDIMIKMVKKVISIFLN